MAVVTGVLAAVAPDGIKTPHVFVGSTLHKNDDFVGSGLPGNRYGKPPGAPMAAVNATKPW